MKIIIECEPKEWPAIAMALQKQAENIDDVTENVVKKISEELSKIRFSEPIRSNEIKDSFENSDKDGAKHEELQWQCVSHWLYMLYQNYLHDKKIDKNKPEEMPCSTCELAVQCGSCPPLNFWILNSVNGGQRLPFGAI